MLTNLNLVRIEMRWQKSTFSEFSRERKSIFFASYSSCLAMKREKHNNNNDDDTSE
jgi:hypothetical protein